MLGEPFFASLVEGSKFTAGFRASNLRTNSFGRLKSECRLFKQSGTVSHRAKLYANDGHNEKTE